MSKAPELVLALNQNANSGECGSCHYFYRSHDANSEWDQTGYCKFRFPPTRIYVKQVWDAESRPLDTVQDTDACDLWKSSGKTFIVSQRVKP